MLKKTLIVSLLLCSTALFFLASLFFLKKSSVVVAVEEPFSSSERTSIQEPENVTKEKVSVKLLFGGDIMLDRYIRTTIRRFGGEAIFQGVSQAFQEADVVVANLEGPITENASLSERSIMGEAKNYIFTFDPSSADLLKREHVGIVNLGNNHILNFNTDGVIQTKRFLQTSGVEYFGSPLSGDTRILFKNFNSAKVAFVNYNQFVFQGREKAFEDIKTARPEADVVILYTHWGIEYVPVSPAIKDLAHQFVDAGVDVIIGSHPHIVQEKEVYNGKTIYYSLGNLIFDQYEKPETKHGLLVKMTLDPATKDLSFEDIPIILKTNGRTMLQ